MNETTATCIEQPAHQHIEVDVTHGVDTGIGVLMIILITYLIFFR